MEMSSSSATPPPSPASAQLGSLLRCFFWELLVAWWHTLSLCLWRRQAEPMSRCTFYEGTVKHVRRAPQHHTFNYHVRYCLLELDDPKPPACCAKQLQDRLSADEVRALTGCPGARVQLLLLPASAGYEQNPICVYYARERETGALQACLAEVTNTPWSDRVTFLFNSESTSVPKPMHVSPLQDMAATWHLDASPPGDTLNLSVRCEHPELGDFFFASLRASRLAEGTVTDSERWAWLMPHRVTWWIYSHAVVLLWRGLKFHSHPRSVDGDAFKRRALARTHDGRVASMACPAAGRGVGPCGYEVDPMTDGAANGGMCPFIWRDMRAYPWA